MENKKRTLLAVLFLLFCLLGIAALYGQARQPAEGTGGHSSNRQKVTLIAKSTESAFWKSVFAGASAAGTEYNMELLCQGADNDPIALQARRLLRRQAAGGRIGAADATAGAGVAREAKRPLARLLQQLAHRLDLLVMKRLCRQPRS